MCGIVGYKSLNGNPLEKSLKDAIDKLSLRGPDSNGTFIDNGIGLGHTRLAIIDTSELGNQPMTDPTGRYVLIFNGEIYNYRELSKTLTGVELQSTCDTEVLLHLLIQEGHECLEKLNGFFALAFYDKEKRSLLIARDKFGIKPLVYYQDDEKLIFGSELKAVMQFPILKEINTTSLSLYLKFNYLPSHFGMLKNTSKLEPGHFLKVDDTGVLKEKFFFLEKPEKLCHDYTTSQSKLMQLLDNSVKKRLMSDVPLGSFLSGGTDSSIISSIAAKYRPDLETFSIGYKDHPFFDETSYAELVAKKLNTNHTTFQLTNDDLLNDLESIINYIDEPFADSSAIPTYILSKHVSKHIKVALSGDGADELFGGYYKHLALKSALNSNFKNALIKGLNPIISIFPQSRSGKITNLIRRLNRYGKMLTLDKHNRYWFLSSLTANPNTFLIGEPDLSEIQNFFKNYLRNIPSFSDYLDADIQMLLPSDMLTKVDLMSMANSLEVRVPFLDPEVVNFARSIPADFKIKKNFRKRILQDSFRNELPPELYNRPKKGFEVPLLQWMRSELLSDLDNTLFDLTFIQEQNLFNADPILNLRKKLFSQNPGDVHAVIWALYIFQKWYRNYVQ